MELVSNDLVTMDEDVEAEDIFAVDVSGYEGPLHLLLDLSRKQKVDLLHVSILELATQYLSFIEEAQDKRIDLAADYLLMAAWLAYLKSRLLLPKPKKDGDGEVSAEDDARKLAFRLRRLDAMREAGEALMDGNILGRDVFLRGLPEQPKVIKTTEYDTTLYHLMHAFGGIRQRKAKEAPHTIENQFVLPLESARDNLRSLSPKLTEWASLDDIRRQMVGVDPDLPPRSVTASVFSATLELTRDGDVDVRQDAHFAPLYLRNKTPQPEGIAP
ncbi:MAG: segregation/condensation protein A [Hyphomonadaceae bacterium]|nr:segregation/condensation protein A [Hyphomonadaceae bacterium]